MISDLGFSFLIVVLNFFIESWFFLKSKVESGFWLNIIHVMLCLASYFVFCFFCAPEFPFLIWYAHIVKKKKGFVRSLSHRIVTLSRPSLPKKKKASKNKISFVVFFIIRVYFVLSIFFLRLAFRICGCVRLIRIWLGFWFWVIYVFVFGNSIVFGSCSRLRFLDIRFGIFISWS